jgi:hypothetical protein
MIAVLVILGKLAVAVFGGTLFYTAVTMFPDEEGELQNRIENVWIRVDDLHLTVVGRVTAIVNRIGAYVTRIYNRVLGTRLISIQMVGVSSASSIAAFFLFATVLFYSLLYLSISKHAPVKPEFNGALIIVGTFCLIVSVIPLVFAFIPSLIRNWFGHIISLIPLLLASYVMTWAIVYHQGLSGVHMPSGVPATRGIQVSLLAALYIGVATDIAVLAAVRSSVRLIATSTRLQPILLAVLLQIAILALITIAPLEATTPLIAHNQTALAEFMMATTMFNFFTILATLAFLILLLVVVLHRVLWPLLSRLVFAVARFKPLQNNRKSCATVGLICVLYGLGFLTGHRLVVWFVDRFSPLK